MTDKLDDLVNVIVLGGTIEHEPKVITQKTVDSLRKHGSPLY